MHLRTLRQCQTAQRVSGELHRGAPELGERCDRVRSGRRLLDDGGRGVRPSVLGLAVPHRHGHRGCGRPRCRARAPPASSHPVARRSRGGARSGVDRARRVLPRDVLVGTPHQRDLVDAPGRAHLGPSGVPHRRRPGRLRRRLERARSDRTRHVGVARRCVRLSCRRAGRDIGARWRALRVRRRPGRRSVADRVSGTARRRRRGGHGRTALVSRRTRPGPGRDCAAAMAGRDRVRGSPSPWPPGSSVPDSPEPTQHRSTRRAAAAATRRRWSAHWSTSGHG